MRQRTIICMKWGTRYGPEYVNRLASMVRRNTTQTTRFVCFTDDTSRVDDGIEVHPLPPITIPDRVAWTPWRKLSVWQASLAELEGDVLFLDLDLVITDRSIRFSSMNQVLTLRSRTGRSRAKALAIRPPSGFRLVPTHVFTTNLSPTRKRSSAHGGLNSSTFLPRSRR